MPCSPRSCPGTCARSSTRSSAAPSTRPDSAATAPPNANDHAWRSGGCEPFSTSPEGDRSFGSMAEVWQPTPALGPSAPAGATHSRFDFVEGDRAAADLAERVARNGVRIAEGPAFTPSPSPSRPPDRCGRPSSRSPTATTTTPRHGIPRTDRSATDASGERVKRNRAPRRPTHADHPAAHPPDRPLPRSA